MSQKKRPYSNKSLMSDDSTLPQVTDVSIYSRLGCVGKGSLLFASFTLKIENASLIRERCSLENLSKVK